VRSSKKINITAHKDVPKVIPMETAVGIVAVDVTVKMQSKEGN
jgi:hypothetical protein